MNIPSSAIPARPSPLFDERLRKAALAVVREAETVPWYDGALKADIIGRGLIAELKAAAFGAPAGDPATMAEGLRELREGLPWALAAIRECRGLLAASRPRILTTSL